MKNILRILLSLGYVCALGCSCAVAGPAFDSLAAVASDGATAPVVFDGAQIPLTESINPGIVWASPAPGREHGANKRKADVSGVPVPLPEVERYTGELPVSAPDKPFMDRAISALANTVSGRPLVDFLSREQVEIRWAPLASTFKEPSFAYACPPEECGGKNVLYLNSRGKYAELYRKPNPTFLAVVLAHELTHLSDYKDLGGGVKGKQTVAGLFLELNGWSTETYVYHEISKAGNAPLPGDEHEALQAVRLNLAIRDYVNGGPRPSSADFPLLRVVDGVPFDAYVDKTTATKRQGSMSLAGVVELKYDLDSSFEEMPNPGLFASGDKKSEYKKYKKLKKSLSASAAEYVKWRKEAYAPPPPAQPPQSNPGHTHHTHDDDGGGYDDGGDSGGGSDDPVDVDPGSPDIHPGSGEVDWGE